MSKHPNPAWCGCGREFWGLFRDSRLKRHQRWHKRIEAAKKPER